MRRLYLGFCFFFGEFCKDLIDFFLRRLVVLVIAIIVFGFRFGLLRLHKVKEGCLPAVLLSISPIWQKYQDLQKKYPDCILIYRLGDFYEVFGDNAVTLSNELGLTLTGRDVGLESRVPMIGFPYHAADSYIKRIIRTHKIAIAETNGNVTTLPEPEDDIEELTEAEMRQFDGDIEEPDLADDEPAFDTSAFDKTALCKLDEIFGNKLSVR